MQFSKFSTQCIFNCFPICLLFDLVAGWLPVDQWKHGNGMRQEPFFQDWEGTRIFFWEYGEAGIESHSYVTV